MCPALLPYRVLRGCHIKCGKELPKSSGKERRGIMRLAYIFLAGVCPLWMVVPVEACLSGGGTGTERGDEAGVEDCRKRRQWLGRRG